nr:AmmeMemoRadiSam system radical SAM enzyme [Desulfobacterales bacterium]
MLETRRQFIKSALLATCGALLFPYNLAFARKVFSPTDPHVKEAYFYEQYPDNIVLCGTCPHHCLILPSRRGRCGTKVNLSGRLYSISYGNPCVVHVDPVEKKPLLHFLPGTKAFSIAVAGCNFHCLNCQNWDISQTTPDKTRNVNLPPKEVAIVAAKYDCKSIAYTYSEATTFYEYMLDTSSEAKKLGINNIWVSNGYMSQQALDRLCQVIDAASINLKSFSDSIYMELNGGHLKPVLNTLETLHKRNVWLEIINLVVPTYTDDLDMIRRMCDWILRTIGPDYPLHFSRFFPRYKLIHLPPTPISILKKAREIALSEGLHHVYIGNVPGLAENIVCPKCGREVLRRRGYTILSTDIEKGRCRFCQTPIRGRWG